jgi:4-oxalocrotonate tautomerase
MTHANLCVVARRERRSRERTMPHVIVKLYSGRSEQKKARLADEITKSVIAVLKLGEESVSVGIQDIEPADWPERVYKPDILDKPETIYKRPGYDPFR